MSDEVHVPTLARDVKKHDIALFGKDGQNGLNGRMNTAESDLYRDPKTGKPGVVPRMERVETLLYVAVALLIALLFGLDGVLKGLVGL